MRCRGRGRLEIQGRTSSMRFDQNPNSATIGSRNRAGSAPSKTELDPMQNSMHHQHQKGSRYLPNIHITAPNLLTILHSSIMASKITVGRSSLDNA
jgi:hypothetical protein